MRKFKKNSQLIQEAMDWLNSGKRWVKGTWTAGNLDDYASVEEMKQHQACMAGTLALMANLDPHNALIDYYNMPCTRTISDSIRDLFPERWSHNYNDTISTITNFNDHFDTTFEDVQLVLKHSLEKELEMEEEGNSVVNYGGIRYHYVQNGNFNRLVPVDETNEDDISWE